MKEFEEQRDSQGITFSEYVPTLLNVFDELLQTDYSNHPALAFSGPANKVFHADKIAIIYPTNDSDTLAVSKVRQYAKAIFDMIRAKKECIFISDEEANDTALSRYAIIAYGTLDSNTFMSKFKSTFPFRVEKNTLYADKEYSDLRMRLISCLPNPLNRELGMVIYTALSNNYVLGINSIFHGPTDYVLSDENFQAKSQGYYKKDEEWKFE